jgi:hypothetical protein
VSPSPEASTATVLLPGSDHVTAAILESRASVGNLGKMLHFVVIFGNSRSIISYFDNESEYSSILGGREMLRKLRVENFRGEKQKFAKCYAHPEGISCVHVNGLSVSVKLRDFLD